MNSIEELLIALRAKNWSLKIQPEQGKPMYKCELIHGIKPSPKIEISFVFYVFESSLVTGIGMGFEEFQNRINSVTI